MMHNPPQPSAPNGAGEAGHRAGCVLGDLRVLGPLPHAVLRSRIYEARHIGAIRLERHRLGKAEGVQCTYRDMRTVLVDLT